MANHDEPDMAAPITRGEFKAFERRIIEAIAQMFRDKFAEQDTRINKRFAEHEADMARGFRAMEESILGRMRAMLEPTNDLPPRVTKLEELPPRLTAVERAVFPPPKRTRRRS